MKSKEDIQPQLLELIRKAAMDLAPDVERAIRSGLAREAEDSAAAFALKTILENVDVARGDRVPMCQDTGTVTLWVELPYGADIRPYRDAARDAVAQATANGWLRQNTIIEPGSKSVANNLSATNPAIHFEFSDAATARATVLLKGGGSENMGRQYSLPDASLGAGRDLDGVEKCIIDAVARAKGNGCSPGVIGVCVGGDRATGYEVAKRQLARDIDDSASDASLATLEKSAHAKAQALGIGPMGLGGKTTVLGVKIAAASRLPASYFVTVAYGCWATRKAACTLA